MSINVKETIEILRDKAQKATTSADALRYSQAAVNLANVRSAMVHTDKLEAE